MAKGPKPNRYNRYKRPEHNSGRMRTMFNTLMAGGAALAMIYGADHAIEKWQDNKVKDTSSATDITVPVEVPWNTQGIVPYPDASPNGKVTTAEKTPPLADGVIWEEKGSKNVRPSIAGTTVEKKKKEDPVLEELRASAEAELKQLERRKKPQIQPQTERIVPDKIAPPVSQKKIAVVAPVAPAANNTPSTNFKVVTTPAKTARSDSKIIYSVPPHIDIIFHEIARRHHSGDQSRYPLLVNVLGSESGFKNVSSPTGATGVGQFTESTFLESVYHIRSLMPQRYQATLSHIEKYDLAKEKEDRRVEALRQKGIKVKSEYKDTEYHYRVTGKTREERKTNYKNIMALRNDPYVSSYAADYYIDAITVDGHLRFQKGIDAKIAAILKYPEQPKERLAILHEQRERDFITADIKILYVAGAYGGSRLLLAAADIATANHRIVDYTEERVARNNQSIFTENGKNMNPSQFMTYITNRVGNTVIRTNNSQRPGTTRTTQSPGGIHSLDLS